MQLSDHDIREFQVIWQQEFGETLSPDQARREALLLLELYGCIADTLCKPPPEPDQNSSLPAHEVLPLLPKIERG
jgi:hypothetical protein